MSVLLILYLFFFFNDTATTEIYTLSLHDALPIWSTPILSFVIPFGRFVDQLCFIVQDRKSTRLNSSHLVISYAVFCLKKKKIVVRILLIFFKLSDYCITYASMFHFPF